MADTIAAEIEFIVDMNFGTSHDLVDDLGADISHSFLLM